MFCDGGTHILRSVLHYAQWRELILCSAVWEAMLLLLWLVEDREAVEGTTEVEASELEESRRTVRQVRQTM